MQKKRFVTGLVLNIENSVQK